MSRRKNTLNKKTKICILDKCKNETKMARVFFKYDPVYYYYYPVNVNEKFLLAQKEDDFILDGFHIRKISHITKVEIKDDLCQVINVWNGITKQVRHPNIDISSWTTIFDSLREYPGFLMIEDDINKQFAIGEIAAIQKKHFMFRQFDANGIWQEDLLRIPYSTITHVAWDTRYTNYWYEYLHSDQRN